ncbi:MAG TPA: hypothetical protein PKZ07_15960, partial [Sedimentisphaerales bacterium]|nr:hypothetical protein [Sedimentisphaerales bacterium]
LRIRRVEMGVFDNSVDIVGGDRDRTNGFLDAKYPDAPTLSEGTRGACVVRHGYTPTIWLPRPPVSAREMGTACHEATHAALHIVAWAGVKTDEEDDETLCHTIAWIVVNIIECGKQRPER